MRIIVFINSLYTGGAEFSTLTLYGWMLKRGYEIRLVCCKKASPSYDPQQFGFDHIHYLQGNNFPRRLQSLNRIIREFQPDLVHSVLFDANLLTRFSRMRNSSFVHLESLVNEMYSSFRLSDPNITRVKLEGYRLLDAITQRWGVDHFHANGISVANHYQEKLKIAKHRITIIPRGRESNPFVGDRVNREHIRQQLQTGDRLMIINVARHEFQKGIDVLVELVSKIGEVKDRIQLVLVGREGNMTSTIQEKIRLHKLERNIVLLGHRNDVGSLLAAADIFVFPSRFEGLPGALIEAEAAGLPIICSDIPNNREVTEENGNALFFRANDSNALAGCLEKLAGNEELRKRLGAESTRIFDDRYKIEGINQRMEVFVRELITKSVVR